MISKWIMAAAIALPLGLAAMPDTADARPHGGGGFRGGGGFQGGGAFRGGGFNRGYAFRGGGFNRGYGYRGGYYGGGFRRSYFGPALGAGLLLGAAPFYYGYSDPCIRVQRVWGPYGPRNVRVNVCY